MEPPTIAILDACCNWAMKRIFCYCAGHGGPRAAGARRAASSVGDRSLHNHRKILYFAASFAGVRPQIDLDSHKGRKRTNKHTMTVNILLGVLMTPPYYAACSSFAHVILVQARETHSGTLATTHTRTTYSHMHRHPQGDREIDR